MVKFWKGLIVAFLIGIGSWATFNIANQLIQDILQGLGIMDVYLQYAILIGLIILLVYILTRNKVISTIKNIFDG